MDVEIILPKVSDDAISEMLRHITKAIVDQDEDKRVGGFLGGTYGYGADWNTPVFEMRPFYWGDCDCGYDDLEAAWTESHTHTDDCYQSELRRMKIAAGAKVHPEWGWVQWPDDLPYDERRRIEDGIYKQLCAKHGKSQFGCAAHCTCPYDKEWKAWVKNNRHAAICSLEQPNFLHRESGLTVTWYKYIGRGMEVENAPRDLTPIFRECLADIAAQGMETAKPPKREAGSARKGDSPVAEGHAPTTNLGSQND